MGDRSWGIEFAWNSHHHQFTSSFSCPNEKAEDYWPISRSRTTQKKLFNESFPLLTEILSLTALLLLLNLTRDKTFFIEKREAKAFASTTSKSFFMDRRIYILLWQGINKMNNNLFIKDYDC